MYFSAPLSCLAVAVSFASASPFKRQSNFPDPIIPTGNTTYCHDPSFVKRQSDGIWFRFCTDGIRYFSSPDVGGPWTYVGSVLPSGSQIQIYSPQPQSDLWAPDVSYHNGTYYVYYAVSQIGDQNSDIGVATSTTMDAGSWTNHGSVGIPKDIAGSGYNEIDPNLYFASGTPYLQFGSSWHDIFQTQLSADLLTQAPNAAITNLAYNSSGSVTEGSFLFSTDVGNTEYYYLFFSNGACCNMPPNLVPAGQEYKVMV